MILVFLDECSDSKFKDYFGLSMAAMNASFYPQIKREAQIVLIDNGWRPETEFKGEFLFSATKGCTDVEVANRVDLAHQLIYLHVANMNRRVKFYYLQSQSSNHGADYIHHASYLLSKALPKAEKRGGKDLVSIVCDERSDVPISELHLELEAVAMDRGFVIHEHIQYARSNFHTIGLMYADLVGYLQVRVDTISNDSEFLENVPPEFFKTNGQLRKPRSSQEILSNVKKLTRIRVDPKGDKG